MTRNRRFGVGVAVALAGLATATPAPAQGPRPDLSGVWQGPLRNLPARGDATPVDVTMEIGPLPAVDSMCAPWRTTYREGGAVRQVKDYRLCRGSGADDFYVDEDDGTRLPARWLGDVLVTSFKVGDALLVSSVRLRGLLLEEEILTFQDRMANAGVQPLVPRGIQRLVLRRRPLGPS